MGKVRATIVLDENIALKVKQLFGGNLSKGVNSLLEKQLFEKTESGFGMFKNKGLARELLKLREEDEKAHELLYR